MWYVKSRQAEFYGCFYTIMFSHPNFYADNAFPSAGTGKHATPIKLYFSPLAATENVNQRKLYLFWLKPNGPFHLPCDKFRMGCFWEESCKVVLYSGVIGTPCSCESTYNAFEKSLKCLVERLLVFQNMRIMPSFGHVTIYCMLCVV